jgi:flagellar motor switch protein FliN/FliY
MTSAPVLGTAAVAVEAAAAAAQVLPSSAPLTPVRDAALGRPAAAATTVVASFTGGSSGTVAVVVDDALVTALAQSPIGQLDVADAVRPALEAAVSAVGPAVLDTARTTTAAELLADDDVELVALTSAPGVVAGWVGLHLRAAVTVPPQRTSLGHHGGLDLLHDVEMAVTVEIGRTRMTVRDLLNLTPGTVVELDRAAGAPADLLVNGRLIARGEVVVVDEDYGIRVTEIVPGAGDGRA